MNVSSIKIIRYLQNIILLRKHFPNVRFSSRAKLDYLENIQIGVESSIGYEVRLQASKQGRITIGKRTAIAQRVLILTATHDPDVLPVAGCGINKSVTIGNDVWIGAGAILLPGVTISDRTIIAAGSIVNKNCDCDCLYGGNPAKKIKNLKQDRKSN